MQTTMLAVLMMAMVAMVRGHGMVIDPPQRSSMWRFGYTSSPKNYDDDGLYCGGVSTQWEVNGGKCGVCGDAYDHSLPRPNEAGGRYATGVIVKTYRQAQVIDVAVKITANHRGFFAFKLCPNNDVTKVVAKECLDLHVLEFVGPSGENLGSKLYIDDKIDTKHVRLQLPQDVTCTQCVLQWTYTAGNSWGCDTVPTRRCCQGCGHQETFVNCADIAITSLTGEAGVTVAPRPVTHAPVTHAPVTHAPETATPGHGCHGAGAFTGNLGMDQWCRDNCPHGFCPAANCACN